MLKALSAILLMTSARSCFAITPSTLPQPQAAQTGHHELEPSGPTFTAFNKALGAYVDDLDPSIDFTHFNRRDEGQVFTLADESPAGAECASPPILLLATTERYPDQHCAYSVCIRRDSLPTKVELVTAPWPRGEGLCWRATDPIQHIRQRLNAQAKASAERLIERLKEKSSLDPNSLSDLLGLPYTMAQGDALQAELEQNFRPIDDFDTLRFADILVDEQAAIEVYLGRGLLLSWDQTGAVIRPIDGRPRRAYRLLSGFAAADFQPEVSWLNRIIGDEK